jgi:hypothetical protein
MKKVATAEVRRVPASFDDDFPVELAQKGFSPWPFIRFYFPDRRTPSSKNEFVDIGSFSDVAEEAATKVESPVAAVEVVVPQPIHPQEEVSPEFTRDLELTIHKGEEPKKVTIQNLSEKGSSLFVNPSVSQFYDFLLMTLIMDFFQNLKIFFVHTRRPGLRSINRIMLLNPPCLERFLLSGLFNKKKSINRYLKSLRNLNAISILLKLRISTLRRR